MEITIHSGPSTSEILHVEWFDHNGIKQRTDVVIDVTDTRPYTLHVKVNGAIVCTVPSDPNGVHTHRFRTS